jgi:hypothetical protein
VAQQPVPGATQVRPSLLEGRWSGGAEGGLDGCIDAHAGMSSAAVVVWLLQASPPWLQLVPWGLRNQLVWIHDRYGGPEVGSTPLPTLSRHTHIRTRPHVLT